MAHGHGGARLDLALGHFLLLLLAFLSPLVDLVLAYLVGQLNVLVSLIVPFHIRGKRLVVPQVAVALLDLALKTRSGLVLVQCDSFWRKLAV